MPVSFQFQSNTADVNRRMSNMVASQMPFATARALNETAKTLVAKNKQDMKRQFRNPVPFTLNAYFFRYARKGETTVKIRRKDKQVGRHYLEVQEYGGQRPAKAFETNFRMNLAWPGAIGFITPTRRTPTKRNGSISNGFLNKVMSQLQVARDPAMRMNTQRPRTRRSKAKQYFVPRTSHPLGQGRRAGVYERDSVGNARKVLNFATKVPVYRPRTKFHASMERYGRQVYPRKLQQSIAHALRTARLR